MKNENFWEPVVFKLKNPENKEVEINSLFIFYIEVNKEMKTFHLTEPTMGDASDICEIYWRTRKYGIKKLLELLGAKKFIQINKTTIISSVYITGRDSDWKYIYLTMPSKLTRGEGKSSFKNIALPLGRHFASLVKSHVFKSLLTVKNGEGDIFFISPLDIVLIESSRVNKTLYLNKPVCRNDKNNYVLDWHSRKTIEELISRNGMDRFLQVHRKYYVRIDYPYKISKEDGKNHLILTNTMGQDIEIETFHNKKIPIGKEFKKKCLEIFNPQ